MYKLVLSEKGTTKVINSFDNYADAYAELVDLMSRIDKGGDYGFCGNEESRQSQLGLLDTIAEGGVDVSELIAKVRSWTIPCIFNNTNCEEVCNAVGGAFDCDDYAIRIVEE